MGFGSIVGGVGTTDGCVFDPFDTEEGTSICFELAALPLTSSLARAKALLNRCWAVGNPIPWVPVNLEEGADGARGVVRSKTEPINERS